MLQQNTIIRKNNEKKSASYVGGDEKERKKRFPICFIFIFRHTIFMTHVTREKGNFLFSKWIYWIEIFNISSLRFLITMREKKLFSLLLFFSLNIKNGFMDLFTFTINNQSCSIASKHQRGCRSIKMQKLLCTLVI